MALFALVTATAKAGGTDTSLVSRFAGSVGGAVCGSAGCITLTTGVNLRPIPICTPRVPSRPPEAVSGGCNAALRPYGAGAGTNRDPYLICHHEQFENINLNRSSHFRLASDIDMTEICRHPSLGIRQILEFSGALDGAGYTIRNLTKIRFHHSAHFGDPGGWANVGELVGLFKANSGKISNIIFENFSISITAPVWNPQGVALLAAWNSGRIENIAFRNSFLYYESARFDGDRFTVRIGGAVGEQFHPGTLSDIYADIDMTVSNSGSEAEMSSAGTILGYGGNITNSVAIGHITSLHRVRHLGGIVGYLAGDLRQSCANVDINDGILSSASIVGGLTGESWGHIEQCTARGNISGVNEIAGLVAVNRGQIAQSAFRGNVTARIPFVGYGIRWTVSAVEAINGSAGGLVATNLGRIETSRAISRTLLSGSAGSTRLLLDPTLSAAGGLVGVNSGTVIRSYSSGTVSSGGTAGGLIGRNIVGEHLRARSESGLVSHSYAGMPHATTFVSTSQLKQDSMLGVTSSQVFGMTRAGGLIGRNEGTVQDSYTWNYVRTGSSTQCSAGGLIGENQGPVTSTYAISIVHPACTAARGGLIGRSSIAGYVERSYYSRAAFGPASSTYGTPLTNAQLATSASFDRWDFRSTWLPPLSSPSLPYPRLQ